ncbi:multidrug transporter [Lysinibacillus sp. BF-4]|uniref:MFS transporter n=1 Tax=Lysinibacillus sp. BF-4 TaxID=1473546 RepID=UPI000504F935|nr:MFS transporter [Lysinibacillus sp. BF-4]KFL42334.1 multidrug transporter [Lysinibacillus sp. BF-4]
MKLFIYAIIFFSFFDLFTQLPVISTFADSLGATSFLTGLAVGMYSLSNTFGNIVSGILTDKKGPFRILVVGLFTTSIALFLYNVASGPYVLLVIRFVHGLVAGFIVPAAFTYLANDTANEKRGKNSAISGAFVGIAAITGPAFSGILANRISVPFVFTITAVAMLILAIIALVVLRQTTITRPKKDTLTKNEPPIRAFFKNRNTVKAFSGAFFLMFSQGVIAYLLPLQAQTLGYDSRLAGTLLSTFGIVAVLVFITPVNRIFDRVAPLITVAIGIACMGVSQILISQANDQGLLYVAMIVYGIGFGLLFPSLNSLLIDSTTPEVRGKAYGYFYAFFSIGVVAGSITLGILDLSLTGSFILTGIILLSFAFYTIMPTKKSVSV